MSLKVGQAQVGIAASSRTAAANHGGPTELFREVAGMSGTSASGAEDEALQFSDSWDDLHRRNEQRQRGGHDGRAWVRFGDILASEAIGAFFVSYRGSQDLIALPTLRVGAMLYEQSMTAIGNRGAMRPLGTSLNRLL